VRAQVAWYFEQEIAGKENAGAEPEHGWRKAQVSIHGERGKADIHAIEEIHREKQHHEGDEAPGAFAKTASSLRIFRPSRSVKPQCCACWLKRSR
jgi:hypothetical protein